MNEFFTLICLRHGQTLYNVDGLLAGQVLSFDISLTKKGIREIRDAAYFLQGRKIDKFYSSDLERCVQSSNIIEWITGKEYKLTELLREINVGAAEGKSIAGLDGLQILEKYGEMFVEDVPAIIARAQEFITMLRSENLRDGDVVLVVTSGGFLNGLKTLLGDGELDTEETPNGGLLEWTLKI